MKRALRLLGLCVALGAFALFLWRHSLALADIGHHARNLVALTSFLGAVLAHVLLILVDGCGWHLLLRGTGQRVSFKKSLEIFAISQFAKYIPGNVAHHIGRVTMARDAGLAPRRVILMMMIEMGWATSAGVAIAFVAFLATPMMRLPDQANLAIICSIAAGGIVAPIVAAKALRRVPIASVQRFLGEQAVLPSVVVLVAYFGIAVGSYFCLGLGANIVARGMFGAVESSILVTTGSMALAWLAGFLVPGAPAGLGVREVVLVSVLAPSCGAVAAAQIAATMRVAGSLADLAGLGLGLWLRRNSSSGSRELVHRVSDVP